MFDAAYSQKKLSMSYSRYSKRSVPTLKQNWWSTKDGFAVHAIHPRPKGQGFSRKTDKNSGIILEFAVDPYCERPMH